MFSYDEINKVIKKLRDNGYLPEYKDCKELSQKIIDELRRFIFDSLTEEEKIIFEKQKSDNKAKLIYTISAIDISYYPDSINTNKIFVPYSKYNTFKRLVSLKKEENEIIPRLFVRLEDIMRDFPDEWEIVGKMVKEYVEKLNSYVAKTEKLEEILRYKTCNLTALKNYYPMLYKYIKE